MLCFRTFSVVLDRLRVGGFLEMSLLLLDYQLLCSSAVVAIVVLCFKLSLIWISAVFGTFCLVLDRVRAGGFLAM